MTKARRDDDVCLASTDPDEFGENVAAVAMMPAHQVFDLVNQGVYEAMSFADMLKVSIARQEAKMAQDARDAALQRAAWLQVSAALDLVERSRVSG
jgi:hypothetical protein